MSTTKYAHIADDTHKVGTLYSDDTVVRPEAVATVHRILEKVSATAHEAIYLSKSEDEQREKMEEALKYAVSALRGIDTALSLGRGGVVGEDGPTGLWFYGLMQGAVIDRDNEFSAHT